LLFSVPLLIVNIFFGWIWLATMSKWSKGKADPTLILPINDDFNRVNLRSFKTSITGVNFTNTL